MVVVAVHNVMVQSDKVINHNSRLVVSPCVLSCVTVSGGTPSEAGSSYCWSPDKVYDWLLKRHAGPIAPSSGYESEVASQLEVMSVRDEDVT